MSSTKEVFISKVSARLIAQHFSVENVRVVSYVIAIELDAYELTEKSTELTVTETESEQLLKLYRGTLLTEGRSEKTVYIYINIIERLHADVNKPLKEINSFDIRVWLAKMQNQVSLRTCENYRLYISGFFTWLLNEEIIDKNPMTKIKPIKHLEAEKKSFTAAEIDIMRSNCSDLRERAEIELLLSSGVRVEELTKLNKSDINFDTYEVKVREGKGKKARTTFMNEVAAMHLKEYLESRDDDSEMLFINKYKKRMSTNAVREDLDRIEERTGIENIHPHRFRRTFATTMHARGMDIITIQRLMGHSNINTTTKYIAADSDRMAIEYKRHA